MISTTFSFGKILGERLLVAAMLVGALVACKSGQSGESKTPTAGGGIGGDGIPWKDKTRQQRVDWMGIEVFPKMKKLFSDFDSDVYTAFRCQTCHGEEMERADFKMPSAIYALSATDPVGEARSYDSEVTAFMVDTVVPEMAMLLDTTPYDPETKTGLSCFACHPAAE